MAATTTENQISLDYKNLRARLCEFEDIMGKRLEEDELKEEEPEPEEEELEEGE